jgi:hypothetical protein
MCDHDSLVMHDDAGRPFISTSGETSESIVTQSWENGNFANATQALYRISVSGGAFELVDDATDGWLDQEIHGDNHDDE